MIIIPRRLNPTGHSVTSGGVNGGFLAHVVGRFLWQQRALQQLPIVSTPCSGAGTLGVT